MVTDLAPVTTQDNVVFSPSIMSLWLAENVVIVGALVGIVEVAVLFTFDVSTVTVTDLVSEPAVNV